MADPMMLYVTAADTDEARRLGRLLVEARLAACANVLGGMTSIYRWQGKIEEGNEAVLIAKTERRHVQAATDLIVRHHSYDCACVVALPIDGGNPDFLTWISDETTG